MRMAAVPSWPTAALGVVQEGYCIGLFSCPLRRRLVGVPALQDIADTGALGGDGFGRGEAPCGVVLHALNRTKLSIVPPLVELLPNAPVKRSRQCRAPECIPEIHERK